MKKLLVVLLFTFTFVVGASAQSQPPSTPITVGQSGNCTGSGTTFYCYTVPMTIGNNSGTAIVYPQGQGGFILSRPPLEGSAYVTALVTSATINTRDTVGRTTQLTVTFTVQADPDGDGDTDTVLGMITLNIAYVGSGRYVRPVIISGSGAQSITQN